MKTTDISQKVKDFLALRFSLGYKVNNADRNLLQGFVTFAQQRGLPITTEMTINWACRSPRAGDATCAWRISRLRGFLVFLKAFLPETEVPGPGLLAKVHRSPPYIYSAEEIVKLLQAAQHIKDCGTTCFTLPSRTLRAHTCETLFGLLVSTGLRVSEAIRLDLEDVRLDDAPPNLLVRETKFRKTRVVPLHLSVAQKLEQYLKQRRELSCHSQSHAFFVSERGSRLRHGWLIRAWHKLLSSANLKMTRDNRRPTIHALRHTFAVRRLLEWQRLGVDVTNMMPHLSVYMGHGAPQSTYWYLTATPELLGLAGDMFERFAEGGKC